MLISSFELREYFHLNFLRHLAFRLGGRPYALEGGICLRFFHRSPRMSEDIDLDISSQVRTSTLQNCVDSILRNRSFISVFIPRGVSKIDFSKPKQTETTQRWKCSLTLGENISLSTKIEFSRRQSEISYSKGIPEPEILSQHKAFPFAAQYYDTVQMFVQKINALASPHRNAARDLFDLHHLISVLTVKPDELLIALNNEKSVLKEAHGKIATFVHKEFMEQVVPFLTGTLISFYEDRESFIKLKEEVNEFLLRII